MAHADDIMKLSPVLLGVSIATNLALLTLWWHSAEEASTNVVAPAKQSAAAVAAAARAATLADIVAAMRDHPDFVAALKSGDPALMRAALEKAGFPPDYVRDIITWGLGDTTNPDHIALLRAQAAKPFWQSKPSAELAALEKEVREKDAKAGDAIKAAYNGRVPPHPLQAMNQQYRYRFLPADKIDKVLQIESDYSDMTSAAAGGTMEAREKVRLLQQEKRADLAKLLTPDELDLYDMNTSVTAGTLRRQMGTLELTEQEFRSLVKLKLPFDEKYGSVYGPTTPDLLAQRQADQQALNTDIQAVLGQDRFAEYQRAQDFGYRAASEITAHFNLPHENAVAAYDLQQSIVKRMQEATRTAGTDRAAVAAQATALLTEANTQLTQLLGAPGLDAYKRTGGMWLRALERQSSGGR
jgi:hypothetical protein